MKVLHVIDRIDRRLGGAMQAVLTVCNYLAHTGVNVDCAASIGEGDDTGHLSREFTEVGSKLFKRKGLMARYARAPDFEKWLSAEVRSYDLVEIHAIFSVFTWRAAEICHRAGIPYVVRPHGSLDPFDLNKHAVLKKLIGPLLIRRMLEKAAGVLLTAPLEAERLVTYGAKVRKVVMPLPVALSDATGDRASFRRKHGVPDDAQVVLFLSRVDYKKGLDFLIPALGRLKAEFPKLWFILAGVGTPEFTDKVHRWLEQHNVRRFTSEVGFVSGQDKWDAFAAADIFALPSLNENFGIVNIEAMHAGLPLLISNEVYICKEIEGADAGVICQPSIESVTEKLRTMLSGALDLPAMGQRGRELVRTRYRPEAATDALTNLYREIVAKS